MKPLDPYLRKGLVILNRSQSAYSAAHALCEHREGCVLVGDEDGYAVGILTAQDLLCRGAIDHRLLDLPLGQVMSSPLIGASEDESLPGVIQIMTQYALRRVPILQVDSKGRTHFIGLVTLDDLILRGEISSESLRKIIERRLVRRSESLKHIPKMTHEQRIQHKVAHQQMSLNHFYQHFIELTHLPQDVIPSLVYSILSFLLMRVSRACALHVMAQLPLILKQKLAQLPAGPHREFTGKRLILELSEKYQISREQACTVFVQVLRGLRDLLGASTLLHLSSELPQEYQPFFRWSIAGKKRRKGNSGVLDQKEEDRESKVG